MHPLWNLGTLALNFLRKPVANMLKQQAAYHPRFRQFIISIGQANHRIITKIQRRIYGHATDAEVLPLNEERAVQVAADLIGDIFFFSVAGAAMIFEVKMSARSEARKDELRKQELQAGRQINKNCQKK